MDLGLIRLVLIEGGGTDVSAIVASNSKRKQRSQKEGLITNFSVSWPVKTRGTLDASLNYLSQPGQLETDKWFYHTMLPKANLLFLFLLLIYNHVF